MRAWICGAAGAFALAAGPADAAEIVTGSATGNLVNAFSTPSLTQTATFNPYATGFMGGVRVAVGDVNGDGVADIVTGAQSGGQLVKVFDGVSGAEIRSFNPFAAGFTGGVTVAAGDINGDGRADLVVGAGSGSSEVKVFDGLTLDVMKDFFAFTPSFAGGVSVAVGDVNGDGRADLVTGAGAGGAPQVKVYDSASLDVLHSFFAFDAAFTGGVNVATLRDGSLLLGTASLASNVRVYDGVNFTQNFFAFDPTFTGGVSVAGGSFGGLDSLIVGTQTGGAAVRVFDGNARSLVAFNAYDGAGGVNVAGAFAAVPEPATWAMLILGFLGLGAQLRRRSAATAA
jgi:hypothetical protein